MALTKKYSEFLFKLRKKTALFFNLYKVNYAEVRTNEEYQEFCKKNKNIYELAAKLNQKLRDKKTIYGDSIYFKKALAGFRIWIKKIILHETKKGFCIYCDKIVNFEYFFAEGYNSALLSNQLICPKCHSFNRTRAMFYVIQKLVQNRKNLKIYCLEQITGFYECLKNWYKEDFTVIGSEFVDDKLSSGTIINGIRHENALDLSFEDESLDFIISNDVYEHVPDIMKTFKEAYRTLKNSGYIVFTVPFSSDKNETTVRAKIENNELMLLMEKEIHGNPMSNEGALAFYNFGWDILKMQKDSGFKDPYITVILDEKFGHIDYTPVLVFVAKKEV